MTATRFKHWAIICGPSPITSYIHAFLKVEISGLSDPASCQSCLSTLFDLVLRFGIPMELLPLQSFREQQQYARNAEETLLVALNACALVTRALSRFPKASDVAFGAWFRRIQGQRTGGQPCIAAQCMSYMDLSNYHLDILDFYGADLSYSDLSKCKAHFANFGDLTLTGTDFTDSMCTNAYFGPRASSILSLRIATSAKECLAAALDTRNSKAQSCRGEPPTLLGKEELNWKALKIRMSLILYGSEDRDSPDLCAPKHKTESR